MTKSATESRRQDVEPRPGVRDRLAGLRADGGWIVLALRGYLAFAFLYAGISKVGGHTFLDDSSPTSMHATLVAVRSSSPLSGLLGPVEGHSYAFGLLMVLAETAVGLGMGLGLFTRLAALGGMVLSLSLFLTVSWNATPWYTGADIVYLFAFTPLLFGGAGPLSLDAWSAARDRRTTAPGAILDGRTRRVVLGGVAGLVGLVTVGAASLIGRAPRRKVTAAGSTDEPTSDAAVAPQPTSTATQPTRATRSAATTAAALVAASAVPVGGAVKAKNPTTGDEVYVLQLEAGAYTALDAKCPHQGCAVSFVSKTAGFACPCHGSAFTAAGVVTNGPAVTGLTKVAVKRDGSDIVPA